MREYSLIMKDDKWKMVIKEKRSRKGEGKGKTRNVWEGKRMEREKIEAWFREIIGKVKGNKEAGKCDKMEGNLKCASKLSINVKMLA